MDEETLFQNAVEESCQVNLWSSKLPTSMLSAGGGGCFIGLNVNKKELCISLDNGDYFLVTWIHVSNALHLNKYNKGIEMLYFSTEYFPFV